MFLLAALLQLPPAGAHDYWIQADPYNADPATEVAVTLHVGTNLVGHTLPNITDWYRDFSYIHQGQRLPMPGETGDDPAGRLPVDKAGLYVIGYENLAEYLIMQAPKFNAYLEEEGLQAIAKQREAAGSDDQAGREYYQRCAKSFVRSGDEPIPLSALQQALGYRLEIIPLSNPYDDHELKVQLLYDGKPQPGLLVIGFTRAQPERRQNVRTDENGEATLYMNRDGEWIVKAVHMVPYPERDDAEWLSFWASLTFER